MDLIQDLRNALEIEQKQNDAEFERIMDLPIAERVKKGYSLQNLEVEFEFFDEAPNPFCPCLSVKQKYIFRANIHCANNVMKFREGDQVLLSHGPHRFKMEIDIDGIDDFVLVSNEYDVKNNYIEYKDYPESGWEINKVKLDITTRLLHSTHEQLMGSLQLSDKMSSLLEGRANNTYSSQSFQLSSNASQNNAISKALCCSSFCLIQGPPGTGKTYTIAKIVGELVRIEKKVFVTGPTHTAINNCLNAISNELMNSKQIVKLGEKRQATEILNNPNISRKTRLQFRSYQFNNSFSQKGFVIGATPYALCYPASKKLEGWEFDYIVFDEAAQLSIPLALAAMIHGAKLIFVGDHKQLDPIIPKSSGNPLFNSSVFRLLAEHYPTHINLLNLSYRLNPELVRIPSKLFYNDRVLSDYSTNKTKSFIRFNCNYQAEIINHESSEVLYIHHDFDGIGRSPFEARITAGIVKDLLNNRVDKKDIAIITPYRAQVREVKRALVEQNVLKVDKLYTIFIDTVERMQGQEKDYVIFTFGNTNPLEIEDRLEFFYSANRLNVAITRAKIKNIVIANEKIFNICRDYIKLGRITNDLKYHMQSFLSFFDLSTKLYDNVDQDW